MEDLGERYCVEVDDLMGGCGFLFPLRMLSLVPWDGAVHLAASIEKILEDALLVIVHDPVDVVVDMLPEFIQVGLGFAQHADVLFSLLRGFDVVVEATIIRHTEFWFGHEATLSGVKNLFPSIGSFVGIEDSLADFP